MIREHDIETKWSLGHHYRSIHPKAENSSHEESLTPRIIVERMIETIKQHIDINLIKDPNFKVLDPACGTGPYLLAWYEILKKHHDHAHIVENMLYGFETNFNYFKAAFKYYGFKNVYKESFLETNKLEGMEFDVTLGNPPYKGKGNPLHLQFLEKCYNLTKDGGLISFVQPATFVLDQKKINQYYQECRNLISNDLISIDIYPKDIFENAAINTALSVSLIKKNNTRKNTIKVKYVSIDKIVEFNNIEEINQFADNEVFHSIREKVLKWCHTHGSLQDIYNYERISKYVVPISKLQRYKFNGDDSAVLNNSKESGLSFDSRSMAIACMEYTKHPFAKFCLHIYKLDMNLTSGRNLRAVPLFQTEYDFKNPYDAIDLTQDERSFVQWVYSNNEKLFFFS